MICSLVHVIFALIVLNAFSHGYSNGNELKRTYPDTIIESHDRESKIEYDEDEWKLRYFPEKSPASHEYMMFADRANMYNVPQSCDDGKTNISIDWDEFSVNHTCADKTISADPRIQPIMYNDFIPPAYEAPHYCMNLEINYTRDVNTFGGHRPLWGNLGEYKFIPQQRWLHNAEHGAVIMLYHPCADSEQVSHLRRLVTSCLKRHIITPFKLLPSLRPLALITWGWSLTMNTVDPEVVIEFIKDHAKRGPENISADGKFDHLLIKPASIVSDEEDSVICPNAVHE